jgi:hypothetical protein
MAGYSHRIHYIGFDHYRLSWSYDHYYRDSNLRHPRRVRRDTDLKGAERFAKKWDLTVPEPK